jgi:type VI secretion system protein
VPPHEITAVGIEMLIDEEAEIADIQRVTRANVASLKLEEDFATTTPHTQTPRNPKVSQQVPETPAASGPKRPEPPPVSAAARIAQRPAPAQKVAASVTKPATTSAPTLDAFFRGAGLQPARLDDKQAEQVLQRLGQIMRELVLGLSENLHVRAEQKNVMRVPTTTFQQQNNNPLKFSASVEEALNNLLFRDSPEYLSAVDAVRETFGDVKQHQQHLLSAMRAAVVDYIGRLDPEQLESKIGRGNALLGAANKLKYWDIYKDLFQVVSQCQPGQFPHQFIEELARAYELEESRSSPAGASRQSRIG